MKANFKTYQILTIFTLLLIFSACEKPKEEPPTKEPTQQTAVDVRNQNSGYDSVLNILANLQGIGSSVGDMSVLDFTLESNNNFNFVWGQQIYYQQGLNYNATRLSYNINAKSYVALPAKANSIVATKASGENKTFTYFFKPYSNFFNYCIQFSQTSGVNSAANASFGGDVSASIPKSYDIIGEPDMGFLYPMMNTLRFPGNINYDSRKGCATAGAPSTVDLYLFKVCNPYPFFFEYSTNPSIPKIVANLLDVSYINKPSGNPKSIIYAFDLRSDSLIANFVLDSINGSGFPEQYIEQITGLTVGAGLSNNSSMKKIRHYSADGRLFGMFFQDIVTKKCWTYSFDYTTHTFTKGLENTTLDYSAEGSDIDLDEYGNVYYSGMAGNGSNALGVSIYKKDISGAVTLIGGDNFLKYGEIVQLKYLFGKVYLAVKGSITGTTFKQLTFLKQQ